MNSQCLECSIRKFCTKQEPNEDWTCEEYEEYKKNELSEECND